MPTTSNFGWTTPADTDLVKDGAAAIRTLGNGVDASFIDLKGGTTDQVLAKNSNTDLDFKWVAQDDSNAIQNALLTTTGDTIYASAASTPARLGVGSSGQVLTVAGGVPTWATPVSGKVLQVVSATNATQANSSSSAYADTGLTATITPTSASSTILVLVSQNGCAKTTNDTSLRLKLFRGATEIAFFSNSAAENGSAAVNGVGSCSIDYVDSPATTSATTYKTQFASQANLASVRVQDGSSRSTIVLMEIGA